LEKEIVYDVIVVGAGMAGLTSAAYLCRQGYRVLLCEKGEKVGGLVSSFEYKGFVFDGGIRAFENSGVLLPMLKELDIEMEMVSNPVSIGIADEWVRLVSKDSLSDYRKMLEKLFPENGADIAAITAEIEKVMGYMDVLYGIDNPLFVDYTNDKEYLVKTLLPWLLKYQMNIRKASKLDKPINAYLKRFTDNQALIDMITQHFFKDTPAFFALSYFGLYLDYNYPIGGTGILAEKMVGLIRQYGGDVRLNTQIVKIDVTNRTVATAEKLSFGYKKLVWCADMKVLYAAAELADSYKRRQRSRIEEQKERIRTNHGGDSIFTVYMTVELDKCFFEGICGAHAFYTPNQSGLSSRMRPNWLDCLSEQMADEKTALKTWLDEYLALNTYEISCPVLRDSSLAPEGRTGVIVSTLMDYQLVKHIQDRGWYGEFKDYGTQQLIALLDASLFPGFAGKVSDAFCSTPLTIESLSGNAEGAITGWAFTQGDLPSENRFPKIKQSVMTPIPHVYQAGQWTFSPSGLPIAILTGKLAADAVNDALR